MHDDFIFQVKQFQVSGNASKIQAVCLPKNEYRKKRALKIAAKQESLQDEDVAQPDTLPISLPNLQQIYFDASTPSLLQLKHRVEKTAVLPKGT